MAFGGTGGGSPVESNAAIELLLSASPMASVRSLDDVRSLLGRANMLLPGLYAWVTTVAFPATQRGESSAARVAAMVALVALVVGPLLAFDRPKVGRGVGVFGFVGACVVTWLLLDSAISVQRLEPVRAALGGVAWALFALGWGAVRRTENVPEDDPRAIVGDALEPRNTMPRSAVPVLSVAVLGALVPVFLAWRVDRPNHALFAHAAALACAIAVVATGARIALERGRYKPHSSSRARLNAAARPLAALALTVTVGLIIRILT